MNIEEYRDHCLAKKGVTESFPFGKLPDVLVFKVLGKMFTATDISTFESISVKSDPEHIYELRATYPSVTTQPYMDKNHWNRVLMDGSIDDELIKNWIDESYERVLSNLPKKKREELL